MKSPGTQWYRFYGDRPSIVSFMTVLFCLWDFVREGGAMPYWPYKVPGSWITRGVIHCDKQITQQRSPWLVPLITRARPVWNRPHLPAQPMRLSSGPRGGANYVLAAVFTEVIMVARRWCGACIVPQGCMLNALPNGRSITLAVGCALPVDRYPLRSLPSPGTWPAWTRWSRAWPPQWPTLKTSMSAPWLRLMSNTKSCHWERWVAPAHQRPQSTGYWWPLAPA